MDHPTFRVTALFTPSPPRILHKERDANISR